MFDIFSQGGFFALLQVILIDLVLAGDNAVVIGMSAARVHVSDRRRVIFLGLAAAVVLRVVLAVFAVHLLRIIPLMIAGGILLLWVCWRLWREARQARKEKQAAKLMAETGVLLDSGPMRCNNLAAVQRAVIHIAVADISMSLDNVLAVAGAAMNHPFVLVIGLTLSVALMGLAASFVATLLNRYPWISYAGIFIVLFVALRMIWSGCMLMAHAA
ncbi:MAG: YjbE family putative metal transport protein [Alphaproteobacteria bacterium]|nr:YjbE family putative metal transport protein [Alphaproteobacteria bacterium]MDE2629574.1 YjbE family putative metal transport protein [Alphaproteobacteria bacterium]